MEAREVTVLELLKLQPKLWVDRPFSLVGEREKVGTAGVVRRLR